MNDPLVELRSLMRETAELVARFESLAGKHRTDTSA